MTTKPQPLTSPDSDASAKERRLLKAGAALAPPAGAKDAIWAELAARLPPPGAPGGDGGGLGDGGAATGGGAAGAGASGGAGAGSAAGGSSAVGAGSAAGTSAAGASSALGAGSAAGAAASAGGAAVLKGVGLMGIAKTGIVGLAVGLVVAGGANVALNHSEPTEPAATSAPAPNEPASETTAPKAAAAPTADEQSETVAPESPAAAAGSHKGVKPNQTKQPMAAAEESAEEPTPAAVDEAVPEATPPPTSAEERKSQLRAESRLLQRARAALRSGNAAGALALLNQSRREFPKPVLGQEHEALVIEALMASGSRAQARQRARTFLKHYPNSPHAATLKKIAGTP